MIRFLLVICMLFIGQNYLQAHDPSTERKWNNSIGIGFLNSNIKNRNISNDKILESKTPSLPMVEFLTSRRIGSGFHLEFGLAYNQYGKKVESKGNFIALHSSNDKDSDRYYAYVTNNFTYEDRVSSLGLPIGLKVRTGHDQKTSFFFGAALQPSIILKKIRKQEGTYETKGLYTTIYTNVFQLYSNDESYDYQKYYLESEKELELKKSNLSVSFDMGFSAPIAAKTDLFFKTYINTGLSDVSTLAKSEQKYFNLVKESSNYEKTKLIAMGVMVGITLK